MVYTAFVLLLTAVVGIATWVLYSLFFHPLRAFPGPRLWSITQLPWHRANIAGKLAATLAELHHTYGTIVRIGPNELSVLPTDLKTWKTLYAHKPEMLKSLRGTGFGPPHQGVPAIEHADTTNHQRMRKALSYAFSEKALREQEWYLQHYLGKLVQALHDLGHRGPQDMNKLFNLTTFDIISDLTFGESFGGLDNLDYHPWVATIFGNIASIPYRQFVTYYHLSSVIEWIAPKKLIEARKILIGTSEEKTKARMEKKVHRQDFMSYVIANSHPGEEISRVEMPANARTIITAGSETAATTLAGSLFFLLKSPETFRKLQQEVRASFKGIEDITMVSTEELKYLECVIQECLRIYPPGPATLPRIVPGAGEEVQGHWVPGDTVIGINHWCTYHSPLNFREPDKFVPERWLKDGERPSEYDNDNREVMLPFSYGPRNCLGQGLAWAEIKLILSRLIFEFDMELDGQSSNWREVQPQFQIWQKPPLMIHLKPRA